METGAIIGVGDPSPVMLLAPSKKSIMLFLAQTAPSRGTLPRSYCEGAPQRMSKQNSARSYPCRG